MGPAPHGLSSLLYRLSLSSNAQPPSSFLSLFLSLSSHDLSTNFARTSDFLQSQFHKSQVQHPSSPFLFAQTRASDRPSAVLSIPERTLSQPLFQSLSSFDLWSFSFSESSSSSSRAHLSRRVSSARSATPPLSLCVTIALSVLTACSSLTTALCRRIFRSTNNYGLLACCCSRRWWCRQDRISCPSASILVSRITRHDTDICPNHVYSSLSIVS